MMQYCPNSNVCMHVCACVCVCVCVCLCVHMCVRTMYKRVTTLFCVWLNSTDASLFDIIH